MSKAATPSDELDRSAVEKDESDRFLFEAGLRAFHEAWRIVEEAPQERPELFANGYLGDTPGDYASIGYGQAHFDLAKRLRTAIEAFDEQIEKEPKCSDCGEFLEDVSACGCGRVGEGSP